MAPSASRSQPHALRRGRKANEPPPELQTQAGSASARLRVGVLEAREERGIAESQQQKLRVESKLSSQLERLAREASQDDALDPESLHLSVEGAEDSDSDSQSDLGMAQAHLKELYRLLAQPRVCLRQRLSIVRLLPTPVLDSYSCESCTPMHQQSACQVDFARGNHTSALVAEVVEQRGKLWQSCGVVQQGRLLLHMEELLFAMEAGSLLLLSPTNHSVPLSAVWHSLHSPQLGCSLPDFAVYSHLRRYGFILQRHAVLWTDSRRTMRPPAGSQERQETPEAIPQPMSNPLDNPRHTLVDACTLSCERSKNEVLLRSAARREAPSPDGETHALDRESDREDWSSHPVAQCPLGAKPVGPSVRTTKGTTQSADDVLSENRGATAEASADFSTEEWTPASLCTLPPKTSGRPPATSQRAKLLTGSSQAEEPRHGPVAASHVEGSSTLHVTFDVFPPNAGFKKSASGSPSFSLAVCQSSAWAPPLTAMGHLNGSHGWPVRVAHVSPHLHVSILEFTALEVPSANRNRPA